jgi:hypothetical protein
MGARVVNREDDRVSFARATFADKGIARVAESDRDAYVISGPRYVAMKKRLERLEEMVNEVRKGVEGRE